MGPSAEGDPVLASNSQVRAPLVPAVRVVRVRVSEPDLAGADEGAGQPRSLGDLERAARDLLFTAAFLNEHGGHGAVPQELLDALPGKLHILQHVPVNRAVQVIPTNTELLLADPLVDVWVVSHEGDHPRQGGGGGVLGGKQEVHHHIRHAMRFRHQQNFPLLSVCLGLGDGLLAAADPEVKHARGLFASFGGLQCHCAALGQGLHDILAALPGLPHARARQADGDAEEPFGHGQVRVRELLPILGCTQVRVSKDGLGCLQVGHPHDVPNLCGFFDGTQLFQDFSDDAILFDDVCGERLPGEQI
mmetsp:Transcript_53117/g.94783  ORF Transcript_53117/g.94783 Transcript_53117/m.94783 type:complete len:304 (-) Transcript_53117:483-1394(-)